MKVLIVGAAGFLGGELVRALGDEHDLTLLDLRLPPDAQGDSRWIVGDVTDLESMRAAVAGHEAVVHTAALVRGRDAQPLERFVDVMVKGTWNVAQACAEAGVRRLVNISSIIAGGWPAPLDRAVTVADAFPTPREELFYALAKRLGEQIVDEYGDVYPELATLNLRPGIIAGDGENSAPARPAVDASHWFNHVDVRDLAGAIRSSLARTLAPRGTYAIVAGRDDALFDWRSAATDIGYVSEHTWPGL